MLTHLTTHSLLLPLASLGVLAYAQWWWSILKHWLPISTDSSMKTDEKITEIHSNHSIQRKNHTFTQNGITTLIPFRNEAHRIHSLLNSLKKIEVPVNWEIIFCDDHSHDLSIDIIQKFINNNPQLDAKIIQLSESEKGKKSALTAGINVAQFDIIHTTDADCALHPNIYWHLIRSIQEPNIDLVLGRVEFLIDLENKTGLTKENPENSRVVLGENKNRHLQQYQLIENSALIALGYTEFLKKNPAAANGANLVFRKSAFLSLGGYQGNNQFASGDDVFTLEKFILNNPESVAFCTHPHASVVSEVETTFNDFKNQRIRWMKKTFLQKTQKTALKQVFMGLFLLSFWVIAIEAVLSAHYETMALLWLGKLCVDAACVSLLLRNHPQKPCLLDIFVCSIFQILWLPTLGVLAANKQFQWKGRAHSA